MSEDNYSSPASCAAVLNAAYLVRLYCRPGQEARQDAALARMAAETRQALEAGADPRAVLYAVAAGLYEPGNPAFR